MKNWATLLMAVSFALIIAGCANDAVKMPRKIVDLSPTITEDLPCRIWGERLLKDFGFRGSTQFEHIVTEQPLYVANSYLTLFNHGGPHVDAPNHLAKGAKGVDAYALEQLFGPTRVLDFRTKPKDTPLGRADIEPHGIRPGDVVLVLVGYTPPAAADDLPSYSFLNPEAAEYLADVPIRAFGTDAWSVDSIRKFYELLASGEVQRQKLDYPRIAPVHYAFLSRQIPVIEQLVNVEALVGERNVMFAGFPLKIDQGNASPIRAVGLVY